jgi:glucose-1-phosphate thymidylyltransferase
MKVIIPVAGAGATLRPFTYTQPKCLIPLAGKTILSFIIDQFIEKGLTEFIFVIGHLGEKIKDYVQQKYPNVEAHFAVQAERAGTGHAIHLCRSLVDHNEPIIVCYGDTICDFDINLLIENKTSCFCVDEVENPDQFGVAELSKEGFAIKLNEKPKIPKSNLALTGIYKINETAQLFDSLQEGLKQIQVEDRFQLTHALDNMIQNGVRFEPIRVENWYDCGKKESLLTTNASILKKLDFLSDEVPFFENTIIVHPVSIAEGCDIQNSIIGPNVTIGENAKINYSIISNSIIGSYSYLERVDFEKSLIGSDASIKGKSQSLNVGDNTELDLS